MADLRQFLFGPGVAFGIIQTYTDGTAPTVNFPRKFDVMQEFSVDFTLSPKELYGQKTYPEAVAIGEGKITGKITNARFQAGVLNDLFTGRNPTSGLATGRVTIVDPPETFTVPAVSPFTYTALQTVFGIDLGVFDQTTGVQLAPVASGPATGQYSVNPATGVYTFSAADANRALMVNYTFTTAASGQTLTMFSELQGAVGISTMYYQGRYSGRFVTVKLPNVVSAKWTFQSKQKDWLMGQLDFDAFATPAGQAAVLYLAE